MSTIACTHVMTNDKQNRQNDEEIFSAAIQTTKQKQIC